MAYRLLAVAAAVDRRLAGFHLVGNVGSFAQQLKDLVTRNRWHYLGNESLALIYDLNIHMMEASVLLMRSSRKSFSCTRLLRKPLFHDFALENFRATFRATLPIDQKGTMSNIDLRSSAIGTTFSASLAFVPRVRARRISSSTTGTAMPVTRLRLLIEIHEVVISITVASAVPQLLHCLVDVHVFLALQDVVHDLTNPLITLAEPAEVSILVLCLALHPEEVSLAAGGEFEDVDAAIGGRVEFLCTFFLEQGLECAVARNHEEVNLRLCGWCGSRAPAEVRDVIFDVEEQIAWCCVWRNLLAAQVALAGLEGDEGVGRHYGCVVVF
jgi:hypothetical protein